MRSPRIATALAWLALSSGTVAGCDRSKDCTSDPACPRGASCRCNAAGYIVREARDPNGDGKLDVTTYERDAQGNATVVEIDLGNKGRIERRFEYTYDGQGRRLTRRGWQLRCDGSKTSWDCDYTEPCAPPFNHCSCRSSSTTGPLAAPVMKPCDTPK